MSFPQPPIEVELFSRKLDRMLGEVESVIYREVAPTIDRIVAGVVEAAEAGEELTDAQLDRLTAPLNDQLRVLISEYMFDLQAPLRDHAATVGPVTPKPTLATPVALLQRSQMEGESIESWLKRKSPSRWQKGLFDVIRGGLRGVGDAATAIKAGVSRLVNVAAETAVWSMANQELELNWQEPPKWLYVAILDSLICDICAPWANRTAKRLNDLPETPQHPRCRCHRFPLFEGSS